MKQAFVIGTALIVAAGAAAALLTLASGDIRLYPLILPFALGFGIVLGLPLYLLSRSAGRAGLATALAAGVLAGAALPALLAVAGPSADQASIGNAATVVNGHYTAYGWLQNLLFVGLFGAVGAAGGLAFWALARQAQPARPWSGGRAAALAAAAAAVIAAAFVVPQAMMDRSCHNTLRDGRTSIAPAASFELGAGPREWRAIAAEVEAFARAGGWSVMSEVRPDDDFQWFQISLCKEPGTNISIDAMPDLQLVSFAVFQPQGGTSWRAPFAALQARIQRRWPGRVRFQRPHAAPQSTD